MTSMQRRRADRGRDREPGGKAIFVRADVTRGADWASLIGTAESAFGRLDVVVNNAGWTHRKKPYLETTEAEFDKVYAVNVKSVYLSAIHAVPVFRKQGGGALVNVASTAGIRPRPGLAVYNSSKAAVILLSKSMAAEFGPERIRVNCVNPVFSPETGLSAEFAGGSISARDSRGLSRHDPAGTLLHAARRGERVPLPGFGRGFVRQRRLRRGRRRALRLTTRQNAGPIRSSASVTTQSTGQPKPPATAVSFTV